MKAFYEKLPVIIKTVFRQLFTKYCAFFDRFMLVYVQLTILLLFFAIQLSDRFSELRNFRSVEKHFSLQ